MQEGTINNKSDRVLKTPFFIYVKKFFDFLLKKHQNISKFRYKNHTFVYI